MHSFKIFCLFVVYLVCINARCVKRQKKTRQIAQRRPNSYAPLSFIELPCKCNAEPSFVPCNCQNLYLDDLANNRCCQCVDSFDILNSEVVNYGRLSTVNLPKSLASFDTLPVPAINLPGLYDFVDLPYPCQALPPCVRELPVSPCQVPVSYQLVDFPCRNQAPIVEYLTPVEASSILKVPFAEPQAYFIEAPKCQVEVIQLPGCGCPGPKIECGYQSVNMPCRCQEVVKPACAYQEVVKPPCGCDNAINAIYGLPCGCQNHMNCGCMNYPQLPVLDAACACQACQFPDLPVYGYGSQTVLPAEKCCGKYLRQVTLQPPFL